MTRHQFFPACPPFVNTVYVVLHLVNNVLGSFASFSPDSDNDDDADDDCHEDDFDDDDNSFKD